MVVSVAAELQTAVALGHLLSQVMEIMCAQTCTREFGLEQVPLNQVYHMKWYWMVYLFHPNQEIPLVSVTIISELVPDQRVIFEQEPAFSAEILAASCLLRVYNPEDGVSSRTKPQKQKILIKHPWIPMVPNIFRSSNISLPGIHALTPSQGLMLTPDIR